MPHESVSSLLELDDVPMQAVHIGHDPVASSSLSGQRRQNAGQLAAGLAHDLNNFLQVVASSLDLIDRRSDDVATRRLSAVARQALTRAVRLSRQLALSQGHELQLETVRLDDLQATMGSIIERAMPESIAVEMRHAHDLWSCMTDVGLLESALLNLAINGRDAMPSGGKLSVTIFNRVVRRPQDSGSGVRDDEFVVASVTDTGTGMPPAVLARAFDPFFTTKASGRGTGLGLSQVQAFAQRCNGYATIESNPGLGTRVSIHLPRAH